MKFVDGARVCPRKPETHFPIEGDAIGEAQDAFLRLGYQNRNALVPLATEMKAAALVSWDNWCSRGRATEQMISRYEAMRFEGAHKPVTDGAMDAEPLGKYADGQPILVL